MKTLHLTNSYHPTSGGISTFYRAMLDAANRERRLMRLVAPAEHSTVEEIGQYGRIYYLKAPSSPFFDRRYRLLTPRQYAPPFRRELRRILEAERPEHRRPIDVLPMGAEVEELCAARASDVFRQSLLDEVQGTGRTRLLLYAGRLSPEKNISLLIDLMAILQADLEEDYRLLIAGSGPLAEWLANEARRRTPGRIHLLGHIADRRRLVDLYVNCDAFVHPNPREPFGIAPLEAMAAGIPLIAPRSGGVLSYAGDSNAWLCEPNAESYAQGIRAIMLDPAQRKDKLAQARWTARHYNWENVTRQFFERYESMMSEFPTTRFAHLHSGRPQTQPKNSMAHE